MLRFFHPAVGDLMFSKEETDFPFVSIIICTYNRRHLLNDCLSSVFRMDYPKSKYEVIIIDGGSTDGTSEIQLEYKEIRFFTERICGLANARNKGAELAKGSIVIYTDDDCIVDSQWIKNLLLGFQLSSSIMGVGGPVFPSNSSPVPKKIYVKAALGLFDEGKERKFVDGIITSNSAFKREIFRTIKFDETLGTTRRGKLILCGEDVDFSKSIIKNNYRLLYTPYAKVYHQVRKDRVRVAYIVKHASHKGLSTAMTFKKEKKSRIWMIRFSVGGLLQSFMLIFKNRSFTTCYRIIVSMSAFFISVTGLDNILI